MKIPKDILSTFINEAENLKFGKISLGYVVRGSHSHFEVDKHITYIQDDELEVKKNHLIKS